MNTILEPSIVVAIIQPPLLPECLVHEPDRMRASSQAGFAKGGIIHSRKNGPRNPFPEKKMYENGYHAPEAYITARENSGQAGLYRVASKRLGATRESGSCGSQFL
jgi:hypothetical protein